MASSARSLIRLVDAPRARIRIGQCQVVVVDHVVMVEGIAQAGVAQRTRRAGLMSGTPIAVERNPDQFDVGDCLAPHVRAISLSSTIRALSPLPVNNTPRSPSTITPRT